MVTREELQAFFKNVDADKRQFALDAIDEYCDLQERLEILKGLPDIEISKTNPQRCRRTEAAKLRKEYSQCIDAKRKTLLMILYRVESSAADDLLAKLAEFE